MAQHELQVYGRFQLLQSVKAVNRWSCYYVTSFNVKKSLESHWNSWIRWDLHLGSPLPTWVPYPKLRQDLLSILATTGKQTESFISLAVFYYTLWSWLIAIVMIKLWACIHSFAFSLGPNLRFPADRLLNQNWTPRNSLANMKGLVPLPAMLLRKETSTNMPSCHPPVLLQAQHGESNPHWSTRLGHTGGSEELLVGNMGFRLSRGVAVDLPQTRSGLKKMEMSLK